MANSSQDPQERAALLQMAQVWLRLADQKTEQPEGKKTHPDE